MANYGSVDGVAALASTWTRDGQFYDADPVYHVEATNPPLATVTAWLDAMTAIMNAALSDAFFVTPIDNTTPISLALANHQVNILVADLVAARNQQGRYFTDDPQRGIKWTRWAEIQSDLRDWVVQNADALINEGVKQVTKNSINLWQTAVILQDDEFNT